MLLVSAYMLSKRVKQNVIKEFGKSDKDSGSTEAQIGLLSRQIKELASHLKKHPKDHHSRRGLLMMVGKRRSFLKYLEREDEKAYSRISKKIEAEAA